MSRFRPMLLLRCSGRLAGTALGLAACTAPNTVGSQAAPSAGSTSDSSHAVPSAAPTHVPTPNLPAPVDASVTPNGAMSKPADAEDDSPIHGTLTMRYIGRKSSEFSDQDAYALVEASVNDPERDSWNAYVSGRVSGDLDGGIDDKASPFHSIDDTHGDVVHEKLYEAWVETRASGFDVLRIGRQELWETPTWVRFDGLQAETAPGGAWKWQLGLYGGQPAHLDSENAGDSVWGAWLKQEPWTGGSARLDVMDASDEERLGSDRNTLVSADLRQQVGTDLGMEAAYNWLDGLPNELDLRANWTRPEDGWLGEVSYHELLNEQNVLAEEFDPFSTALLTYEPYWEVNALLAKSFDAVIDLQGGWDTRRLNDAADAGEFNREYDRGFLTGAVHDVLVKGCTVTLTGEHWYGGGSEMATWGGDVTQQWGRDVSASVGSYYSMYKDDFLLGQERQDVRAWYAKLKLRTAPTLTWTFGFDHEQNSIDTYDTITLRAQWSF
jgi:hypothetical protein